MLCFLVSLNNFSNLKLEDQLVVGRLYFRSETSMSRKHCKISFVDDKLFVEDLESSNETIVNDHVLKPFEPAELKNGDSLILGEAEFQVFIANENNFDIQTETRKLQLQILDSLTRDGGHKEMPINMGIDDELDVSITIQLEEAAKRATAQKRKNAQQKIERDKGNAIIVTEGKNTTLEFSDISLGNLKIDKKKRGIRKISKRIHKKK